MSETNLDKKIINLINIYNSSDYNSAILLANELIDGDSILVQVNEFYKFTIPLFHI